MSQIINDVRQLMNQSNAQQLNIGEIWSRLSRVDPIKYGGKGFRKDNLMETLQYYKKLSVVYVD